MNSSRRALLLIWICFVVRGLFYSAMFPIWEGYDEPFHLAYIQELIHNRAVPGPATPISREVQQSLHVLPLPWTISQDQLPPPILVHDDYWKLEPAERRRLEEEFRAMPLGWQQEDANESIGNYEAQQTPLYYLLFYFPVQWMSGFSLAIRVFFLRILNILLASLVVPLGYLVARGVLKSSGLALAAVALIAVLPELFVDLARVGNEGLALVLYTLALYFAVKAVEGSENFKNFLWLGITLALGLLTKAYFLTALPALFVLAAACFWRWPGHRKSLVTNALLAGAAIAVIAGPWYWRVHKLTGSWSGISYDAALHSMSRWHMLAEVRHVNWAGGMISILLSHVWFGGWSFLKFPRVVYLFFGAIILASVAGMCRVLLVKVRGKNEEAESGDWRRADSGGLGAVTAFYAFFWLGLIYDLLITYVATGYSASTGWYMYALIVAEIILFYFGLSAVMPRSFRSWILPALTALFALLDLSGMHFYMIPYYCGVIFHTTPDRVAAASLPKLVQVGIPEFGRRLSINKPDFLGPAEFGVLWIAYLAATALLVYMTFRLRNIDEN